MATHYLFVYGTLMPSAVSGYGRAMRDRLMRESHPIGPALVPGRLYDLGQYPGLAPPAEPSDVVHGVLLALSDPQATWPWLDAYEGIVPGAEDHAQYLRVVRTVTAANGAEATAWLYLAREVPAASRRIASGRWAPV